MLRIVMFATAVIAACGFAVPLRAAGAAPPASTSSAPTTEPKIELNDLEKRFEKAMSGATLVGRFSVDGNDDQLPKEDRYVISRVAKIGTDLWLFTASIGTSKIPIPLPVPVKWAGDTPVISVTNLWFPGLGTYSARVLIYGDQYAGTWSASGPNPHGGHLWGRIEKLPTTQPASTQKAEGGRQKAE